MIPASFRPFGSCLSRLISACRPAFLLVLLWFSSLPAVRHDPGRRGPAGPDEPVEAEPAEADSYEPNDSRESAVRLEWPAVGGEGWAEIQSETASVDNQFDFDFFHVDLAAGDSLAARLTEIELADPPLDPVLSILDSAGTVLAYSQGLPAIVSVTAASAAGYYVLVNDRALVTGGSFGPGGPGRSYRLVLRRLQRNGDVDGSGAIDYRDAFYVYMLASGLLDTLAVSPAWRRAADLDGDGVVTGDMDDFRIVFRALAYVPGRDPRLADKQKAGSPAPALAGSAASWRLEFADGSIVWPAAGGVPAAAPAGSLAGNFLENSLRPAGLLPPPADLPSAASLSQNRPNPFNPSTSISFSLAREGGVSLAVFDLRGRLVKVLARGILPAGGHAVAWDGTDARGRRAASGVYVYRLSAGGTVLTRKMVLVK